MAGISCTVEQLPDNDAFLSRDHTRKLLEILAAAIPVSNSLRPDDATHTDSTLLKHFKETAVFNELTGSIFWRHNVMQNLEKNIELLNTPDQYMRSALNIAISNEDFTLSTMLVNKGAILMLADKLVLEITLTSILQRDSNAFDRIISYAPSEHAAWVTKYLSYIKDHAQQSDAQLLRKLRDLFAPPIRHFGQILDTLAIFDGVPSYYGYIAPSLNAIIDNLNKFVSELPDDNETKQIFTTISDGMKECAESCKFIGNIATNENCSTRLQTKISRNINSLEHQLVMLCGGFAGNCVNIAYVDRYLIYTNYGIGGNPNSGIQIYEIEHPENITVERINRFINGLGYAQDPNAIIADLETIINPTPIYILQGSVPPNDNCILLNSRACIQGIILLLHSIYNNKPITADGLKESEPMCQELYQQFVLTMKKNTSSELVEFIRNPELFRNNRLQCCSLAVRYINQHFEDKNSVATCIELKNALEFVGLKDYLYSNLHPEAYKNILEYTIRQQELTALQVISLEQKGLNS